MGFIIDFNKLVKLNEDKYSNEDLEKLVDYDLYNDIEYMMGEMFYQGCLDLDKNIAEAEKWYKKGGDNGNELALYKSYEVYEESKDNNQLRDVDESTEL